MNSPRTIPRINVNFLDLIYMDKVELAANKQGLSLQDWIRHLIADELAERQFCKMALRRQLKSALVSQALLERMSDESTIKAAKWRAEQFIERLENIARHQ